MAICRKPFVTTFGIPLLKIFFASQKPFFVCLLVENPFSGKAGEAPADFTGTGLGKVYQCSHPLLKKEESILCSWLLFHMLKILSKSILF